MLGTGGAPPSAGPLGALQICPSDLGSVLGVGWMVSCVRWVAYMRELLWLWRWERVCKVQDLWVEKPVQRISAERRAA